MEIRAAVLDVDGTLINSCEYVAQAIEDTISRRGRDVTRTQIAAVTGKPIVAMYAELMPGYAVDDYLACERDHFAHHAAHPELMVSYDLAGETLMELEERGLKLGVFTGFDARTRDNLARFNLDGYFETIVDCTQYEYHKPNPEGLYIAMERLGVTREETVYVGDGISDMGAGRAADVAATIGITHGFTPADALTDAGAEYLIHSLPELLPLLDTIEAS
ncbi:MAG TPA: HAD-IA family hydrolase [Candidatus Saccharimonadales bacterium]|jgi:HAD superfamily hydrolase (TIGR01549 family)|nr:HAD-IA family hydrolase [Candidatus Saccharimonadales bacterium]